MKRSSLLKKSEPLTRYAALLSRVVLILSCAVIVIWVLGGSYARDFMASEMNFQSAVATVFAAMALFFATRADASKIKEVMKIFLALIPLIIGGEALVVHYGHLGASSAMRLRFLFQPLGFPPLPANSAFCVMLIALALLVLDGKRWLNRMAQRLAIAAGCVALFAICSYLIRMTGFNSVAPFTEMNPLSALTILLLSIGVLLAKPQVGVVKALRNKNPSGVFARRMMTAAFGIPPALGWLGLLSVDRGFLSSESAWALVSLVSIVVFASFVWQSSDAMANFEETISESELRFRSMANSIPQLAWMAEPDGSIYWYNQRWYAYTGTSFEQMQGWGWKSVQNPDTLPQIISKWQAALKSGEPWEDVIQLKGQDGTFRWFLSRAMPLKNEFGEVTKWFGSNTDIDDQKLAAEELYEAKLIAERASQAKTQFLANVSHEIRTPINAIMGFTDLLKNTRVPAKDKENFMMVIERNSANLLRLIDDLLDLSKVEAGKIELENSTFHLPDFLRDFCSATSLRAAEKGILFLTNVDDEIPRHISTDQLRLRQILANVVGNAIKFTDKGSVELKVSYKNANLIFVITDTGPGISVEARERLFKPFSQADATFTRKYGGTGLGLILSRRLSQLLGGELILSSSEIGTGSSFTATVRPALVVGASAVVEKNLDRSRRPNGESNDLNGRLNGLNVLLVEDSPDNRMLISMYLKKTGALIEIAEDGLDGFDKATASSPDVVLMDIQMPKVDGHSATRNLRANGFSKPIIALTAHAMREERDKCFESGCNDFLTKPIQRDKLIEVLARYIPAEARQ